MGKGDKKSKRGKIIAGSYGKKRPRKASSPNHIPVKALAEDDKKAPKEKVKKEVQKSTTKSENAEVDKKPKTAPKPKAEKTDDKKEEKPKTAQAKKTED